MMTDDVTRRETADTDAFQVVQAFNERAKSTLFRPCRHVTWLEARLFLSVSGFSTATRHEGSVTMMRMTFGCP